MRSAGVIEMDIQLQSSRLLCSSVLATFILAIAFGKALAGPANGGASSEAQAVAQEPAPILDAMWVCGVSGSAGEPRDALPAEINTQLSHQDNRIEGQDWSGQDLAGKNFRGKVLVHVSLKNAKLRKADLSGAIICGSDLSGADLTGAKLEGALIAGGTRLNGSNLTNVSAHRLIVADATYENLRIDGADLRDARFICEGELSRCLGKSGSFATMTGADLRGATVEHLWPPAPGLGSAHLAGMSTPLDAPVLGGLAPPSVQENSLELASGVGPGGQMAFFPAYGYSGSRAEFSAEELTEIPAMIEQMQAASVHPSFECSQARGSVEKAICADPRLAALDAALNWLWGKLKHTPALNAAQKKWLSTRATCAPADRSPSSGDYFEEFLRPEWFAPPPNPTGCIGMAYIRRIKELAPQSSLAEVRSGTYTTDPPLELPQGKVSTLAKKYLKARGYRQDEIAVETWGGGTGKIAGEGTWANGHMCGFVSSEKNTKRIGSRVQVFEDGSNRDDRYSASFVITPQVAIWVGGQKQFQCGARGGWSIAYFRQPDKLFATVAKPERKAD
jgi:uncharacterized protein YjbI with pentapeptide repeats/uncharacterized protein YecT (DUF1311 family)